MRFVSGLLHFCSYHSCKLSCFEKSNRRLVQTNDHKVTHRTVRSHFDVFAALSDVSFLTEILKTICSFFSAVSQTTGCNVNVSPSNSTLSFKFHIHRRESLNQSSAAEWVLSEIPPLLAHFRARQTRGSSPCAQTFHFVPSTGSKASSTACP